MRKLFTVFCMFIVSSLCACSAGVVIDGKEFKHCNKNADCKNGFCDNNNQCYQETVECIIFCKDINQSCVNFKCVDDNAYKKTCPPDTTAIDHNTYCQPNKCSKNSDCQSGVCYDGRCGKCNPGGNQCSGSEVCFENPHYLHAYGREKYEAYYCAQKRYECKTDTDCGKGVCNLQETRIPHTDNAGYNLTQPGTCTYDFKNIQNKPYCAIRSEDWEWVFFYNAHQILHIDPRTGVIGLGIKAAMNDYSGPSSYNINKIGCFKLLDKKGEFIDLKNCYFEGMVLVNHQKYGDLACIGNSIWDIQQP